MKILYLTPLLLIISCASIHLPFYDGNATIRVSKNSDIAWKKYKSIGLREITVNGQISSNTQNEFYRKTINDKIRNNFPELKIIQMENLHQTLKNDITNHRNFLEPDLYLDVAVYAENSGEFKDISVLKVDVTTYVNVIDMKSGIIIKSAGAGFLSSLLDAQSTSLDIAIKRLKRKDFWIEIPSIGKSRNDHLREAYELIEKSEYDKGQVILNNFVTETKDEKQKAGGFYALSLISYLKYKKLEGERFLLLAMKYGLKDEEAWTLIGKMKNIKDLRGTDYGRIKDF